MTKCFVPTLVSQHGVCDPSHTSETTYSFIYFLLEMNNPSVLMLDVLWRKDKSCNPNRPSQMEEGIPGLWLEHQKA